MNIETNSSLILGVLLAYFLGITQGLGANGIWYGLTLGLLVSSALLFMRFQYFSRKLILSIPD